MYSVDFVHDCSAWDRKDVLKHTGDGLEQLMIPEYEDKDYDPTVIFNGATSESHLRKNVRKYYGNIRKER
jgi:hypothetical protein